MKLHTISINNLKRRKAKMAFLTVGLMVGIATIVTLVALTRSMSSDIERKMDEFGANILVTPQSNGLAMNYGGISLGGVTFDQHDIREEDLAKIKTIANHKNISAISPKVLGGIKINNHDVLLVGVNFENELKMKQWWKVFGNEPKSEHDILLGSDASKVLNVSPGDSLNIKGEQFTVAGVLDQTGSQDDALVFASLPKAQKLLGKEGKITMAEVAALCSGCPIGDMVTQIAEKIPDAKVSAIQQVVEGRLKALDQFNHFSYAMAGVVISDCLRHHDGKCQRANGRNRYFPGHRLQEESYHAHHPAGGGPGQPDGRISGVCRRHGRRQTGPAVHGGEQECPPGLGHDHSLWFYRVVFDPGDPGQPLPGAACQQDGPDRGFEITINSETEPYHP